MKADGSELKQLTRGPYADHHGRISPDGQSLIFSSNRAGPFNLWRLDLKAGQLSRLTKGHEDRCPEITRDARCVIFWGNYDNRPRIWKVPIGGGTPSLASSERHAMLPAVSPESTQAAFFFLSEQWGLAVSSLTGGPSTMKFNLPPTNARILRWTPDGRGLAYVNRSGGTSNIWVQPLEGQPPYPLTDFKDEELSEFDFSADGNRLAMLRETVESDVVLISSESGGW
jgi:Tol biopolymer transport system component